MEKDPLDVLFVEGPPPPRVDFSGVPLSTIIKELRRHVQAERTLFLEIKDWLEEIDGRIDMNTPEWRRNHALYERVVDALEAINAKGVGKGN